MENLNFIIVFIEGVLSFFSPCVLPLVPMYIAYLSGNAKQVLPNGEVIYNRTKTFLYTFYFILGICFSFFLLGISFSVVGRFFNKYSLIFTKIGGIIIILMGLFQLGILNFKFLKKEMKLNLTLIEKGINPIIAFLMGFTFSFAWTPCVGPALSSVLILASGSQSVILGNILVLVYSLGFVIPFLILGLFTSQMLNFLRKNQKIIKYTIKISGILLILIGIMTFNGSVARMSEMINKISSGVGYNKKDSEHTQENKTYNKDIEPKNEKELIDSFDFQLEDQYGNMHTLSEYKGKVVFLNFWATWCEPCKTEMPHIEEIFNEYGENKEDVIILGVANPRTKANPNNLDSSKDEILDFLNQNNYKFPVLFDETGEIFREYYINSIPTTFMITKSGKIYGYVPGMLNKDNMNKMISETLESEN